jgi:hypothetical protein
MAEVMLADPVLQAGNLLEDIFNTSSIRTVVRDGELYNHADLDSILAQIVDRAKRPR